MNFSVKLGIGLGAILAIAVLVWLLFVPPYNKPKFEMIENNQTGFLIPLENKSPVESQLRFESVDYLKDKKVSSKRVQINRRWIQQYWFYGWGEYIEQERLITVDRSQVTTVWAKENNEDDSLHAQTKDGTGIRLNFTCTAYIPESDKDHQEGAEHFLYYYRGDSLVHVLNKEVRGRAQAVAAEFCARFSLEEVRGTQHELAKAVREDIVPFFKQRGVCITNIGLEGGFQYVNTEIQKAIDDAIKAQQLKITAMAQQEKEKVENETKLKNIDINNQTYLKEAEGLAKAKLAAAKIEAEAAKVRSEGEATAIKITADAEAYKLQQLDKFKDLMLSLKKLDMETKWRSLWTGGVPSVIMGGEHNNALPLMDLNKFVNPEKK